MKHLVIFVIFCNFLFYINGKENSFSLVADINVKGLVGTILFTQENRLYPVNIRTELQPNTQNNKLGWEIHEIPILWDYSNDEYCKTTVYKSRLIHDLTARHGLIQSRALYNDEFLTITNFELSIAGHSLVIVDPINGPISCSTILPVFSTQGALKAEFSKNIAGDIFFIPYFDKTYRKTLIIGSLYKTNGETVTKEYDWYIGQKTNFARDFICVEDPKSFRTFNPTNRDPDSTCKVDDGINCEIGNMVSKHRPLRIGNSLDWTTVAPFAFKDQYLPLEGINSIAWKSLIIVDKTTREIISCAIIKPIEEEKYRVEIRKSNTYVENNVLGIVYFKQQTPYHSTYVKIRIKEQENWKFNDTKPPVFALYDLYSIGVDCNTIGTIVVDQTNSPRLLLSPDNYEDYNKDSIHTGIIELGFITGFTLSGQKSILGKTVAVFENFPEDEIPSYCGQILPVKTEEAVALISNFTYTKNIYGYIVMVQYLYGKNMQFSDTLVIVDLENINGSITLNHKIHIHENLVYEINPEEMKADLCISSGGHFNPLKVSTLMPMYKSECQKDFMKRCEVGDLDGKLGLFDIGRGRKLFIDTNLNLFGMQYDLKRSIVVHGDQMQKTMIGCSRIKKFNYDEF